MHCGCPAITHQRVVRLYLLGVEQNLALAFRFLATLLLRLHLCRPLGHTCLVSRLGVDTGIFCLCLCLCILTIRCHNRLLQTQTDRIKNKINTQRAGHNNSARAISRRTGRG